MCGCDIGYTCPRCEPAEDWYRADEAEREQDARWDAPYALLAGEDRADA